MIETWVSFRIQTETQKHWVINHLDLSNIDNVGTITIVRHLQLFEVTAIKAWAKRENLIANFTTDFMG